MTDKELKRLSKKELVDIIFALQENEQKYLSEITVLEEKLAAKDIKMSHYGSLAEAAIGINNVIEQAQAAADMYLAELKKYNGGNQQAADSMIANAKKQANMIVAQAYEQRDAIFKDVNMQLLAKRQEFDAWAQQFKQLQVGLNMVLFGEQQNPNQDNTK